MYQKLIFTLQLYTTHILLVTRHNHSSFASRLTCQFPLFLFSCLLLHSCRWHCTKRRKKVEKNRISLVKLCAMLFFQVHTICNNQLWHLKLKSMAMRRCRLIKKFSVDRDRIISVSLSLLNGRGARVTTFNDERPRMWTSWIMKSLAKIYWMSCAHTSSPLRIWDLHILPYFYSEIIVKHSRGSLHSRSSELVWHLFALRTLSYFISHRVERTVYSFVYSNQIWIEFQ